MQITNISLDNLVSIFISYARDDKIIADEIADVLISREFGVKIDRRDLPVGEEWANQIERFVLESDMIVWLVSGASLNSSYCQWELGLAANAHKKIIPVVISKVDHAKLPEHLGKRQALPAEGVFDSGQHIEALVEAINLDIEWIVAHSKLAGRARDWHEKGRPSARLLHGDALVEAESWLAKGHPVGTAGPSGLEVEYISQSQRWRRILRTRLVAALFILLAGAGVALFIVQQQRLRADNEANLKLQEESFSTALEVDRDVNTDEDMAKVLAQAMSALPDPARGRIRPYVARAEGAAMKAFSRLTQEASLEGHTGQITYLAIAPTSGVIASASTDNTVRLWSGIDKTPRHVLTGHTDMVLHTLFNSVEDRLYTASADGTVRIWSLETGAEISRLEGHTGPVTRLALSPDGKVLASASHDGTARLWSLADNASKPLSHFKPGWTPQKTPEGELRYRKLSKYGKVWSGFSGQVIVSLRFAYLGVGVTDVKFAPNGTRFYTSGEDGRVVAWSQDGDMLFELPIDDKPIFQIEIDFATQRLVAGTATLGQVWDLATRKKLHAFSSVDFSGSDLPVTQLALTPDQQVIVGYITTYGGLAGVYLWDMSDGRYYGPAGQDERSSDLMINAMDVGPKGIAVLDGSGMLEGPGLVRRAPRADLVRLTTVQDGKQLIQHLKGHGAPVTAVRFTPDGTRFVSGDRDGVVKVWNPQMRELRQELVHGNHPVQMIKFATLSADGRSAVTVNTGGHGIFWDLSSSAPRALRLSKTRIEITGVGLNSPAENGGLKVGDAIVKIDGQPITEMSEVVSRVRPSAGRPMEFSITRNGRDYQMLVTPVANEINENGKRARVGLIGMQGTDRMPEDGRISALLLSGDEKHLFGGTQSGAVAIWDVEQLRGQGLAYRPDYLRAQGGWVRDLSLSKDGTRLLAASDKRAILWDWRAGKVRYCAEVPTASTGGGANDATAALSPDGIGGCEPLNSTSAQTPANNGPAVVGPQVIPSAAGEPGPAARRELTIAATRLSPTGDRLVVVLNDGTAEVVTLADGGGTKLSRRFRFKLDNPDWRYIMFSPDGNVVYSADFATGNGKIAVWDVAAERQLRILERGHGILTALALSPATGKVITADADHHVKVIDPQSGAILVDVDFFGVAVDTLKVTPDEKRIMAAGSGSVGVLDFATGALLWTGERHAPPFYMRIPDTDQPALVPESALQAAFSPSSRFLLSTSRNMAFLYEIPETTQALLDRSCEALRRIVPHAGDGMMLKNGSNVRSLCGD